MCCCSCYLISNNSFTFTNRCKYIQGIIYTYICTRYVYICACKFTENSTDCHAMPCLLVSKYAFVLSTLEAVNNEKTTMIKTKIFVHTNIYMWCMHK